MEMNFCRRCGTPLHNVKENVYECTEGHTLFAEPAPTVGIFFVSNDNQKVLLATRGIEPSKGKLDSLGGFLKLNESLEQAAVREIQEESALDISDYESLTYFTSSPSDYQYQNEPTEILTTFFWARLKSNAIPQAADDVASVDWYDLAAVDFDQLASDDIRAGIRELHALLQNS